MSGQGHNLKGLEIKCINYLQHTLRDKLRKVKCLFAAYIAFSDLRFLLLCGLFPWMLLSTVHVNPIDRVM